MERSGMNNPETIRFDCVAITVWILRFAQNDGPYFCYSRIFLRISILSRLIF